MSPPTQAQNIEHEMGVPAQVQRPVLQDWAALHPQLINLRMFSGTTSTSDLIGRGSRTLLT